LPWIPVNPVAESDRSLAHTAYYKLWESGAEEKCRSLQLQRMIAATIPYYLLIAAVKALTSSKPCTASDILR